ncbi:hypothetical protein L207DRAFT_506101, partial [Hyaloscypha variabilis F]
MPKESFHEAKNRRSLYLHCPYFDEQENGLHRAFDIHMNCAKNVSSKMSNIYKGQNDYNGRSYDEFTFHITFYEYKGLPQEATRKKSYWKSGAILIADSKKKKKVNYPF